MVSEQQITVVVALRWLPRPIGVAAGVTLRLTDRDDVLFPEPMPVDFEVVNVVRDWSQPINTAVLIAVTQQIRAMARELAAKANRQGDLAGAGHVLAQAAAEIRALAAGGTDRTGPRGAGEPLRHGDEPDGTEAGPFHQPLGADESGWGGKGEAKLGAGFANVPSSRQSRKPFCSGLRSAYAARRGDTGTLRLRRRTVG